MMKQLKKLNPEIEEALNFFRDKAVTMDLHGPITMMQFFENFQWQTAGETKDILDMFTMPEENFVGISILDIKEVEVEEKYEDIQTILFYMKDGNIFQCRLEV